MESIETLVPEVLDSISKKREKRYKVDKSKWPKPVRERRKEKQVEKALVTIEKAGYQMPLRGCKSRTAESAIEKDAFEYYWQLKDRRTLAAVQRKFGVTKQTVINWCKKWKWYDRCRELDAQDVGQRDLEPLELTMATKKLWVGFYRLVINELVDKDEAGNVVGFKNKNVEEVLKMMKDINQAFSGYREALGEKDRAQKVDVNNQQTQVNVIIKK